MTLEKQKECKSTKGSTKSSSRRQAGKANKGVKEGSAVAGHTQVKFSTCRIKVQEDCLPQAGKDLTASKFLSLFYGNPWLKPLDFAFQLLIYRSHLLK